MIRYISALISIALLLSCNSNKQNQAVEDNKELSKILDDYYRERMDLFPIEATWNGDTTHNDKFYPDFTDSYRAKTQPPPS